MPKVYISIGSNIERERNVRAAVRLLRKHFGTLTLSRVYQTPAEGFEGEDFYNLVAAFDTTRALDEVLAILHSIEDACGRVRGGEKFSARTLDLDILLYDDLVRHDGKIDIPRNEITKYAFVLGPLAELAPNRRHPESGRTFAQLWENFDGTRRVLRPVELRIEAET